MQGGAERLASLKSPMRLAWWPLWIRTCADVPQSLPGLPGLCDCFGLLQALPARLPSQLLTLRYELSVLAPHISALPRPCPTHAPPAQAPPPPPPPPPPPQPPITPAPLTGEPRRSPGQRTYRAESGGRDTRPCEASYDAIAAARFS
eukprot:3472151-Pleurochrysis_carterae.AAC.3